MCGPSRFGCQMPKTSNRERAARRSGCVRASRFVAIRAIPGFVLRLSVAMTLASKPVLTDVSPATEPHYSVAEVAGMWKLSKSKVRKIFRDEPGVLALGEPRPKYGRRRGYVVLRIPQSVLERVYRRQCVGG